MATDTGATSSTAQSPPRSSSTNPEFFTPAEDTFNPRPYAPNPNPASALFKRSTGRPSLRAQDVASSSTLPADPIPGDPDVLFMRPPFNSFPDSDPQNNILTYKIMAEHPNWFLLVSDFKTKISTDPDVLSYPSELEPPRGWCANKRELQRRGIENWPEGEEPRLRCTFCRRTYAGVNAKSMWRRHVYEKHKIAMSNRRDATTDPPKGGRGSNKENKGDLVIKAHDTPSSVPADVPDQLGQITFLDESSNFLGENASPSRSASPDPSDDGPSISQEDEDDHTSPPSTPSKKFLQLTSSPPHLPSINFSPYDPHRTPNFRHSPKRLPLDQPWKYASPTNPVHAKRTQSLTSLSLSDHARTVGDSSSSYSSMDEMSDPEPEVLPPRRRPPKQRLVRDLFQVEHELAFGTYVGLDSVLAEFGDDEADGSPMALSSPEMIAERASNISTPDNSEKCVVQHRMKRALEWESGATDVSCVLDDDWDSPVPPMKRRKVEEE